MLPANISALIVVPALVSNAIVALREAGWHQPGGKVRKLPEQRAVEMNEMAARGFEEGKIPPSIQTLITQGAQVHIRTPDEIPNQLPEQTLRLLPLPSLSASSECCCGEFSPFTFSELFSGIGGFRVALDYLGGKCVFSCDKDESARNVYKANFGEESWHDILTARTADIPKHDILVGGFPCQPFSVIGQQKGFLDARGTLFREVVRILSACQPKAFILENVPGLVTMEGGEYLRTILRELSGVGYTVGYKVLDARGLVPQVRCRVFVVGIRTDLQSAVENFAFPSVPALGRTVGEILELEVSLDLFLSPALWAKIEESNYYKQHPTRKLISPQMCAATLIRNYKKSASFCQFVQPKQDALPRLFSPRECARLQGFPETFSLPVVDCRDDLHEEDEVESKSCTTGPRTAYKLLGNAVPPPLVALVAGALLCALQHTTCNPPMGGCRRALELCGLASISADPRRFCLNDSQMTSGSASHASSSSSSASSSSSLPIASEETSQPLSAYEKLIKAAVNYDNILLQFQAELRVENCWLGKIIGKGGATIGDIRNRCPSARIFFPKALARTASELDADEGVSSKIRLIYFYAPTQAECEKALSEVVHCLIPDTADGETLSSQLTLEQNSTANTAIHVHPKVVELKHETS